uniref:Uncharacterized protein n=1 Tax=Globodera rostochiensis TaxID=31243 RepID=A0A914I0E8_GLORO
MVNPSLIRFLVLSGQSASGQTDVRLLKSSKWDTVTGNFVVQIRIIDDLCSALNISLNKGVRRCQQQPLLENNKSKN